MAKKKREKKYKVCVSTSPPGKGWKTVCKKLTKKQIAKLVGFRVKGRITEVSIF